MRYLTVINRDAGTLLTGRLSPESISDLLEMLQLQSEILIVNSSNITNKLIPIKNEKNITLIAAGGDGTVHACINAMDLKNSRLGIIPLGTFNHCARDLGIPLDIKNAVSVIKKNFSKNIDLGKVNNHYFINNASIGLYPEILKKRNLHQKSGYSKASAMVLAWISTITSLPGKRISITYGSKKFRKKIPFVFIGNNDYRTDLLNYGSRKTLEQGLLSLFYSRKHSRISLSKFLLLPFQKPGEKNTEIIHELVTELKIKSRDRLLSVSMDGEIKNIAPPLICKTNPGVLKMILPDNDR